MHVAYIFMFSSQFVPDEYSLAALGVAGAIGAAICKRGTLAFQRSSWSRNEDGNPKIEDGAPPKTMAAAAIQDGIPTIRNGDGNSMNADGNPGVGLKMVP
ncbi:hypothetical protein Tco_0983800 [Tanacetum coccineum]